MSQGDYVAAPKDGVDSDASAGPRPLTDTPPQVVLAHAPRWFCCAGSLLLLSCCAIAVTVAHSTTTNGAAGQSPSAQGHSRSTADVRCSQLYSSTATPRSISTDAAEVLSGIVAATASANEAGVFVACGVRAMVSPFGNVTVQTSQLFVAASTTGLDQQLPRLWVRLVVLGYASIQGVVMRDQEPSTTGPSVSSVRSGGAIYVGGVLLSTNTEFRHNTAPAGGAIFVEVGGHATFKRCQFIDNHALMLGHAGGGAIFTEGAATVVDCTFVGNVAGGAGGGIYGYGELTVSNSVFTSNVALFNGTVAGVPS